MGLVGPAGRAPVLRRGRLRLGDLLESAQQARSRRPGPGPGRLLRLALPGALLWAVLALAAAAATAAGLPHQWASDALSMLNPPTIRMVLLGVNQACALQLLSPVLERLMALRPMAFVAWLAGSRALTLYLWHLPVIVAVMAAW